uniref:Hexosyltransferase n=1 Tax=Eutreptiella gymnastica TaxID=73025 RepID=A0A7S4LN37_9EUGL
MHPLYKLAWVAFFLAVAYSIWQLGSVQSPQRDNDMKRPKPRGASSLGTDALHHEEHPPKAVQALPSHVVEQSLASVIPASEPPGDPVLSALVVTLYNESPRARLRFFQCIKTWEKHLQFVKRRKYPIIVFYLTGVKDELSADQMQTLRASAPSLVLEFHPVTHVIPQRFRGNIKKILEHQMPKRGLGYIFCSQFLGFEMFKHPRLQSAEYILRLDDDITFDADAATDLFEDMHRHNISVGWNCIKKQWDKSSAQMDGRIQAYVDRRRAAGLPVQPAFDDLMPNGTWNMRLYAGCVEVYRAALYVSEAYYAFLEEIDMLEGIYMRSWMEQAFKTLWMAIVTPPDAWRRYACELPTLHRGTRETWFDYVGCAA